MGIKHKKGFNGFGWYGSIKFPVVNVSTFNQSIKIVTACYNVQTELLENHYQIGPFPNQEEAQKCIEDINNYQQHLRSRGRGSMPYPDWKKSCAMKK
jgi:hypothetical protein